MNKIYIIKTPRMISSSEEPETHPLTCNLISGLKEKCGFSENNMPNSNGEVHSLTSDINNRASK